MHFLGAVKFCKLHGPLSPTLVSHILINIPISYFFNLVCFGIGAKAFVAHVRKSTHATEEFRKLQKQQVLKDTPGGTSPITNPEVDESEENEGEEEVGYSNEGRPIDKGTSPEGSSGYKVELLVLDDRKVMTCYAICIIPCVPCLPCNYSFEHAFLHICEGETEICCVIYVGSWSCGGPWRSTLKRIQQITENHWKYCIGRPWSI